ncbi:MAG TPA: PEPxxWA-CTERM sorting domain-containing protein [Phenylobacterium sp.]|jgi:hypothetical protein|nr:PEPxxWA-CTERM sorting domain-containing protein [Phenylobacterium sp.]
MKKFLSSAAAAAFCVSGLLAAPAAHAAVFVSQLVYKDNNSNPPSLSATPYGTVTITELTPDSLKVEVDLTNPASEFVNTGGKHNPFVFNTLHADQVTTPHAAATDDPNAIAIDAPVGKFEDAGRGAFESTPFGTFTNEISLNPEGDKGKGNGQANGQKGPMIFTVTDPNGITFAGIGATFSSTGQLLTTGTGDRFTSTTTGADNAGWWFAADIYDGATGSTYNVAARDAFEQIQNAVPEPATWGLMIVGFGGVGAVLRRRRATVAALA